jgi:hypothetical protein
MTEYLSKQQEKNLKKLYENYKYGRDKIYLKYKETYNEVLTKWRINEWLKQNKTNTPRYLQQLNKKQEELLKKLYYQDKQFFGRDKFFYLLKTEYPEYDIKKKQLYTWLSHQYIYQIYKPINKKIKATKPFIVSSKSNILGIDLIDYSHKSYRNYKYILVCVDLYSRYIWLYALKNKTVEQVESKLKSLLKDNSNFTTILRDNGKEFELKDLKNFTQILSKAHNPTNNAIVERTNRNIQSFLRKYLALGYNDWSNQLKTFQDNFNKSFHSTLKNTPYDIYINKKSYVQNKKIDKSNDTLIPIGANVRIINMKKLKNPKLLKHETNYSKEIYIIWKVDISPANIPARNKYHLINTETKLKVRGTFNNTQLEVIKKIEHYEKKKVEQEILKNKEIRDLEIH